MFKIVFLIMILGCFCSSAEGRRSVFIMCDYARNISATVWSGWSNKIHCRWYFSPLILCSRADQKTTNRKEEIDEEDRFGWGGWINLLLRLNSFSFLTFVVVRFYITPRFHCPVRGRWMF